MGQSIWMPVEEFDGRYEVSNDGRVRNALTASELSRQVDAHGRPWVSLWSANKGHSRRISRLMGLAFLPAPEPGETDVCHNDGDAANNVVSNLRWDTHAANMADIQKHGTGRNGNSVKTHCKWGHEFTPENTCRNGNGRKCRTCANRAYRAYRARKRRENEAVA